MKQLKLFNSHAEQTACTDNFDYVYSIRDEIKAYVHYKDYSVEYLTFETISDGTFTFAGTGYQNPNNIQYSTDNGETWSDASTNVTINVAAGDRILWKGEMLNPTEYNGIGTFQNSTAVYNIEGNIMSLVYSDNFIGQTDITGKNYMFFGLFKNTQCINAKNLVLPSMVLCNYCYGSMFYNCTQLVSGPKLPATTLAYYCYGWMYQNTNVLPDCTNINFADPVTVTSVAFGALFYGTKVTDEFLRKVLPINPVTNHYCLPVTDLTGQEQTYASMFNSCTLLVTAPELPATTLIRSCYVGMFEGCTSLITAPPELPATTLADFCYENMFSGCTSLVNIPAVLPATTMTSYCYDKMFQNCTSITRAPELSALTLYNNCYLSMFNGCTSLVYIKAMFTTNPGNDYTSNWVRNVSATGTFVKNSAAEWTSEGNNSVPTGWTIETVTP